MIILTWSNASKIINKGFNFIDTKKVSLTTTGYVFNDTPEVRQAITDTKIARKAYEIF